MADVITTLHPEGIPTDNLYPNIKKENLPSALQPVADFALSEYEKTLNLWDGSYEAGKYVEPSTGNLVNASAYNATGFIPVKPNTTYYFSENALTGSEYAAYYDSSKTYVRGNTALPRNGTFTTPNGAYYIRITLVTLTNVMLTEGSVALPYQPYNGDVMHAIDVNGVILWENANPTSAFANQTVTISDSTGYKRLKFVFKRTNDNYVVPIILETNNGFGDIYLSTSLRGTVFAREVHILSYTSIQFEGGTEGTTVNNSACVPVAVYGIK